MYFDRRSVNPRKNWQALLEEDGMYYHTIEDKLYWNESNYYYLDIELVDKIEDATNKLHEMCLRLVDDIISRGDYRGYNFTDKEIHLIEASWSYGHKHLYGRFDLGIGRHGNIKMFEYNADTPTSLLEASVIQWNWKEQTFALTDQFNSIHESLIEQWKSLYAICPIYFTTLTDAPYEDWGNLHYLMETATEAGLNTSSINLECVGWDETNNIFVDLNNKPIDILFKLYPWEWLMKDQFAENVLKSNTVFIEPAWKMLLSNKMLCARLWEHYPNHDLLLEAYDPKLGMMRDILNIKRVCKPKLGREGQGIFETNNAFPLNYSDGSTIVQAKFDVVKFDNVQPVIGSWVIGDKACGIGIREDVGITTNNSKFVPHVFY